MQSPAVMMKIKNNLPLEFTPTEQQLRDLKIAHDNAGHPSNADFARLLRRGNARPDESVSRARPVRPTKARRPTAVPKTYSLNHVVGLDLVQIKNTTGVLEYWLNCVCW